MRTLTHHRPGGHSLARHGPRPAPRRGLRAAAAAVLAGMLLVSAAGCDPDTGPAGATPVDPADTLRVLDSLPVGTWASMSGYSRDRFPHWSGQGEGCDTRDVVLRREGTSVQTGAGCKITQGTWLSPYDGTTVTDPQQIDIDHMVPLANAWRTGAKDWTEDQRERFANDLDHPQLVAVTATTNRAKGDQDPSRWKPPRREYWCLYAQRWVAVKSVWQLRVTAEERDALRDMLAGCR